MSTQHLLRLVKQRDPVSPGSVNRPISQVHDNFEYLYQWMEAAEIGSTIYARQVTIEADAQVGMPVYLNATSQRFERGLANVETDLDSGVLFTASSASIWGVVSFKHNATLADLLLFGYADLDISAAAVGTVTPGTYYLSGTEAGRLVRQRPPVSVPVLRAGINGKVFVNPTFVDFLDAHRHYRFELVCSPAGHTVPPEPEGRHVITEANSDWPGWLPADHAIFEGLAPQGAIFGYNLKEHPALQAAWPPLPIQHCYLEWDKGKDPTTDEVGYEGVPLGNGGLCIIDRHGIWWMSDCSGDAPWPLNLTAESEFSESLYSEHSPPECPRETHMSLVLWFTKMTFATDATVVTSLVSLDERLKIYCAGTTTTGSAGDLEIDLDLSLTMGDTDRRGYLAMKVLEDDHLHRGPVAEGIYTTSPTVLLTSDHQTLVDPEDEDGLVMHHGRVRVNVLPQATIELPCQLVRLQGAIEEDNPVLYVGLPADIVSAFIAKFEVPADTPAGSQFQYRARIMGRSAPGIALPQLTVEYMIASRPPSGTPTVQGGAYTAMTIDTTALLTVANQAIEATSEAVEVAPGDLVYVKVTRTPIDNEYDTYPADVGFVQQVGLLVSGS